MIQRWQSVFFLLASGVFGLQFATDLAKSNTPVEGVFADQLYNISDHPGLLALTIIGILISLLAVFLYNKRPTQIKLAYLTITVAILLPVIAILLYTNQIGNLQDVEIEDQAGLYLPIGTVLFAFLAIRFIKKDEKLVSSMDRLR